MTKFYEVWEVFYVFLNKTLLDKYLTRQRMFGFIHLYITHLYILIPGKLVLPFPLGPSPPSPALVPPRELLVEGLLNLLVDSLRRLVFLLRHRDVIERNVCLCDILIHNLQNQAGRS